MSTDPAPWILEGWQHPTLVRVDDGHHLRPIGADDVDLDFEAVTGSRERLWSIYGQAWGWPPADLTLEQDRLDLARHAEETAAHESFSYGLFPTDESAVLGCVYVDPPGRAGADADVSWWVVDELAGTDLERRLGDVVHRWVTEEWPLARPRFLGRDLSWDDWLALPEL